MYALAIMPSVLIYNLTFKVSLVSVQQNTFTLESLVISYLLKSVPTDEELQNSNFRNIKE